MNMRTLALVAGLALLLAGGFAVLFMSPAPKPVPAAAADDGAGSALVAVTLPAQFSDKETMGARAFAAKCAACHGDNAAGRDGMGPPLVHIIYEPSHHGDQAFHLAATTGVRAHHWPFGNMPPVEGLTKSDVDAIVAYVRALQRANGIL